MSIVSAPAFHGSPDPEIDATPQTNEPPKSMTGIQPSRFETSKRTGCRRKMTEKGLAYLLKIKLTNRHSVLKKLKEHMEKILKLCD